MDKIIESLGKLLGLLGKVIEAIFASKTFWIIVVAVAILSLVMGFAITPIFLTANEWKMLAIASIALILARVIIWVVDLLLKQFA